MIGHLTNHIWQSTLFAAVVWFLALAFRENRAQVRYWLWFGASVKFLLPFSWLMGLGSIVKWAPVSNAVVTDTVSLTIAQITQPFPDAAPFSPMERIPFDWIPVVVLSAWLCGLLSVVLMRFRGWLRIQAAIRSSYPLPLPFPVEVRSSPGLLEPGVVGLCHPLLLIPTGIVDRLTADQMETIVAHELCHVRRRDNLLASIHMIVEALFWFHPLVWWIGARLMEERERACDEGVLNLGSVPRVYAEAILQVCEFYVELPLPCSSGVTGSDLRKRIEAILANRIVRRVNRTKKVVLILAGAAALALPVLVGIINARPVEAQAAAGARPRFEVASVKPCRNGQGRRGGTGESSPGHLNTGCIGLTGADNLGLIQRAYVRYAGGHTNPFGIIAVKGGPAWIRSEMYEISAKAEGNPGIAMMQGPMLQTLLEDRFRLKIHRETRDGPVYALTVVKDGSKLKPFKDGSCIQMPMVFPLPTLESGQRYCKAMISTGPTPWITAEGSTLTEFSKWLNLVLDRPVIDNTGLTSRVDIHLEFSRDQATPGLREPGVDTPSAAAEPAAPTLFTAIQEQLGLKLVPTTGRIEFLVVDHVERPSKN